MLITAMLCGTGLLAILMISLFASERGPSHFDHWLELRQARKLAEMNNKLELEKLKLEKDRIDLKMLESPTPSR